MLPSRRLLSATQVFFQRLLFRNGFVLAGCCLFLNSVSGVEAQEDGSPERVQAGLQVLYDFSEGSGDRVQDRAGVGKPLLLKIANVGEVNWLPHGLQLTGNAEIRSEAGSNRLNDAIRQSGEVTLEAWVQAAHLNQAGPARIVTLSQNPTERNLTLGQERDRFEVRLRTTKTSNNGIPGLESRNNAVAQAKQHVVVTRTRDGLSRLYVNGQLNSEKKIDGDLSNWNANYRLAFGNEMSNDRPWQGTLHLVAIYNRALDGSEVAANFRAGHQASRSDPAELARMQQQQHFEKTVAAVLVNHCFECHDASTREGGLDLSRLEAVFRGGDSGKVLIPGQPEQSTLWTRVHAGEMPVNRDPLTSDEREVLRKWIADGAVWSLEQIDPSVYTHGVQVAGNWIRRLTIPEYIATVRDTLGVDIAQEARELLPPDLRADGFSNTAYNLGVDLQHIAAYSQLAEQIVAKLDVSGFAARFSKNRKLDGDLMRELTEKMGRKVLRGPLTADESTRFLGIANTVIGVSGEFDEAVGYMLQAMLQSPRFLYRIERQRGDGSPWPVDDYELASRLSYLIWGTAPDDQLLELAGKGELRNRSQLERQVERLLQDSRAIDQSIRFVDEWLNLGKLQNLRPNEQKFPNWSPQLAGEMREETRAYFREVVWTEQRPLSDLLNAQFTFLTPELARHYGIPANVQKLEKVDLTQIPGRGGILTQGSTLTVGGDEASMVSRGLFVLHDLLRGVVKDPPPCVDATPVSSQPGKSQRAVAMERLHNATCSGCHGKFEPLAFGLEKFDGLGSWHERDEFGNVLREDGEVLFPGDAKAIPFQTSAELMNLLASNERVQQTLTWKVVQFSLGRPLVVTDVPYVQQIHNTAQAAGGTWSSLMKAIVLSDFILSTRTETE